MDEDIVEETGNDTEFPPDPETPQERERFWQEVRVPHHGASESDSSCCSS